jgi:protein SCO1/2
VTFNALRGKVVVMSDMVTLCQGTCPLDTADLVAAARQVHAAGLSARVAFLSITLDPRRDTRARLAAYRRQYRPAPRDWYVLTGSPTTINRLWDALGVYRRIVPETGRDQLTGAAMTYDVTHSDEVFFLDAHSRERCTIHGVPHIAPRSTVPPELRSQVRRWSTRDALAVVSRLLHVPI